MLEFENTQGQKYIPIKILPKETKEERNEMFGLKLYSAEPEEVKISKKHTICIEIVTDHDKKRQKKALTQLL